MVVILLFVGVALSPVITADDNNTEMDDVSIDNSNENGKSDSYKEIITLIYGNGRFNWIFRRGLFRGSAVIRTFEYDKLYLKQIEDEGYDSIQLDENWIMFDPERIKVLEVEMTK